MKNDQSRPPGPNGIIAPGANWPICYESGWAMVRKADCGGYLVVKIGGGKWFAADVEDAIEQANSWERYCIGLQGWASLSTSHNSDSRK